MEWWQALVLGSLQGLTEFLPISSSGHLVLAQYWLGLREDRQAEGAFLFFDGMLHLGTLVSVLLYYRHGLREHLTTSSGNTQVWPNTPRDYSRLLMLLALATAPAVLAVVMLEKEITESFKQPHFVAFNLMILGALLCLTDLLPKGTTSGLTTQWWQVLAIGMTQACSAVFRGLSRSGMTIASALAVGLHRDWAVRFSFLMSIVANLGFATLGLRKAIQAARADSSWLTTEFLCMTLTATVVSAVVGYLTIDPLIRLVRRCRLWWFAVYVWIVGGSVLLQKYLQP
jgi:undecaprenyl-diphosphatase